MANVEKLPSGRWRARWRDSEGRHSETFDTKRAASEYLAKLKSDKTEGAYVSPVHGRQAFGVWYEHWHNTRRDLRDSSRARNESHARVHILPSFAGRELASITQPEVRAWVTALVDKGLAPATVEKVYQIFSQAMQAAVDAGLIARAPTHGIVLPEKHDHEMRFLDAIEVERLHQEMPPRYKAFVYLAAYGGLRVGEMAALRVGRVDFSTGSVTVAATLIEVRGVVSFGEPKTKAGKRTVKLPPFVMGELKRHIATYTTGQPTEPVFQGPRGGVLRVNAWRRRYWAPAVSRAGLAPLRIHDLRHTAVSLWIAANVDPKVVAARAGHRSVVTVYDRYGHLYPDREDELVRKLEEMRTPLPRLRAVGHD